MTRFLLLLVLFAPMMSVAHEGHGTEGNPYSKQRIPIESEQAREFSGYILQRLIERGKLDFSWEEAEIISVGKVHLKQGPEWEVIYRNVEAKKPTKQNLYIFLSIYGEYTGANFTGQ